MQDSAIDPAPTPQVALASVLIWLLSKHLCSHGLTTPSLRKNGAARKPSEFSIFAAMHSKAAIVHRLKTLFAQTFVLFFLHRFFCFFLGRVLSIDFSFCSSKMIAHSETRRRRPIQREARLFFLLRLVSKE